MITTVPIQHILILSMLLFFIGLYGFLVRKNLINILMGLELMLNSVNLNFVIFNKYLFANKLDGLMFSLFLIAIAAAETAIAIAITINIYRKHKGISVSPLQQMKY